MKIATKGPTYINGNSLALEGPQIPLIRKHAGGSINGCLARGKVSVLEMLLSLHHCQSVNPKVLQSVACMLE